MRKPSKPTQPVEPTTHYNIEEVRLPFYDKTIPIRDRKTLDKLLDDYIQTNFLNGEVIDDDWYIDNIYVAYDSDFDGGSYLDIEIVFKGGLIKVPNSYYNSQLKSYKKELKGYPKKLEQYEEKLKVWKEWNIQNQAKQKEFAKKRLLKQREQLESELNKISKQLEKTCV